MFSLDLFGSHQFRNVKDYFKPSFSGVCRQVHEKEKTSFGELVALGDQKRMLVHRGAQDQGTEEYP